MHIALEDDNEKNESIVTDIDISNIITNKADTTIDPLKMN
jgi:hypothetical protein